MNENPQTGNPQIDFDDDEEITLPSTDSLYCFQKNANEYLICKHRREICFVSFLD